MHAIMLLIKMRRNVIQNQEKKLKFLIYDVKY